MSGERVATATLGATPLITGPFWWGVVAQVLAGAAVAIAAFWWIQRNWEIARDNDARRLVQRTALSFLRDELLYDRRQAKRFRAGIGLHAVPYPAFKTNGWDLLIQADVLRVLDPDAVRSLRLAYNRMRTINDLHREYRELTRGLLALVGSVVGQASGLDPIKMSLELEKEIDRRVHKLQDQLDDSVRGVISAQRLVDA